MAIENLTTYTEVDAPGRLSVAADAVTITDLDRDENVNLYKDFGAGYFDALDIDFRFNYTGGSHGTLIANSLIMGLTANVETAYSGLATTDVAIILRVASGPVYNISLVRGAGVTQDDSVSLSTDTTYYCTFTRAAGNDTITLTIYSDSARTTTVDTLSVAGYSTATYRYLYAVLGFNDAVAARALDAVVGDIDLNRALTVTLPLGTLNLTGIIPTLKLQTYMPVGTLNLTGLAPTLQHKLNMVLGTLNLTGLIPTLDIIRRIRLHAPKRDTALLAPERDLSLTAPKRDFNLIAKRTYD